MRITNSTLLRGYNRDLNRVMNLKNKSEHMITTTRRFSRASEDPLAAAKALNVRKSQTYSTQYQENLKVAAKFYTEAETSLIQVSEQMAIIRETIIAACNTTKDYQDLDIYAQQLETKAEELCAIFNTDSAGRAIFGGESDNAQPFDIINDTKGYPAIVTYHGIPVNSMRDYTKFPYADEVNLDIGLGMAVNQETHEIDPDSVLKISFIGPQVTGCGSERGVADVDLTSIMKDRSYSLYVYAGDVKQEINFIGQSTQEQNVAEINRKLKEAYKKEIAFGRDYPEMDAQGVISLRDKMGDAVDDGIVSVINNPYPPKHTSQIKVDNDSNYTDKYRLRLSELPEGMQFKIDVQLGDGEKKTIEFEAGTDNMSDPNNPVFREDITVKNFQAALDEAFGKGVVNISANDPTKGVVSAEGQVVKLFEGIKDEPNPDAGDETAFEKAEITTASTDVSESDTLYLAKLDNGTSYAMRISIDGDEKPIVFEAGKTPSDTKKAIAEAIEREFPDGKARVTNMGKITYTDKTGKDLSVKIKEAQAGDMTGADTNVPVEGNDKVDLTGLTSGKSYVLSVAIGDEAAKDIQFTAGADSAATKTALDTAIKGAFPDAFKEEGGIKPTLTIDNDGKITYKKADGTPGTVKVAKAKDPAPIESVDLGKETAYRIDLDKLEDGKEYSLKFIVGNDVKNITFTAGADKTANQTAINDALGGFATVDANGNVTSGDEPVSVSNNPAPDEKSNTVFEREHSFSYNYIQLTLDAARALREGDIGYANACIDRLVTANEKLLVEIADMGCNEEFIDFNISRLTIRDENLAERQNDLEIIDPAKQITLWKQYEAMYNACLQMSSSVVPQSIFDYI